VDVDDSPTRTTGSAALIDSWDDLQHHGACSAARACDLSRSLGCRAEDVAVWKERDIAEIMIVVHLVFDDATGEAAWGVAGDEERPPVQHDPVTVERTGVGDGRAVRSS
jgi:hypothetical protein